MHTLFCFTMTFVILVHDWLIHGVWRGIHQSWARIIKDIMNSEKCYIINLIYKYNLLFKTLFENFKFSKIVFWYFLYAISWINPYWNNSQDKFSFWWTLTSYHLNRMLFSILYSWSLQQSTNVSIGTGVMIFQRFYKSYLNVGVLADKLIPYTIHLYWLLNNNSGSGKHELYHIQIVLIKPLFDKIVSTIYKIIQTISFMSLKEKRPSITFLIHIRIIYISKVHFIIFLACNNNMKWKKVLTKWFCSYL